MGRIKPNQTLDLIGVACPQNAARALLKLEAMESGSILEVIVDDGEPIKNVSPSIKDGGHEIIDIMMANDKWRMLIRRG